jgi:hypothetical protein
LQRGCPLTLQSRPRLDQPTLLRIPMMSAGHSEMMSATVSDPSRPAVPIDVGRVAHRPLDWFGVSMVLG